MKKVLCISLCVLILVCSLLGCSKESGKKLKLRDDLLEYGGDFWTKENKDKALDLVDAVQDAYNAYKKDKDLEQYTTTVSDAIYENLGFILDVSDSIDTSQGNAAALLSIDILNINARNTDIMLILELGGTDEELENKVHNAVNAVTYAFCNKEIAK